MSENKKEYGCIDCGDKDFIWYTYMKSKKSVPLCKKCATGKRGIKRNDNKINTEKIISAAVNKELTEIRAANNGRSIKRTLYDYKTDSYKEYVTDGNGDRMYDDNGRPIDKKSRRKWTKLRHRQNNQ